jgi:hypothetical protein
MTQSPRGEGKGDGKKGGFSMKKSMILIILISFIVSAHPSFATPMTSTLKDQQNVAVTIYNSNVGLGEGYPAD